MTTTRGSRLTLRVVALAYVLGLLALPILVILYRTFEPGLDTFIASIRTPAAIAASVNLPASLRNKPLASPSMLATATSRSPSSS